jgi:hypothetical protein
MVCTLGGDEPKKPRFSMGTTFATLLSPKIYFFGKRQPILSLRELIPWKLFVESEHKLTFGISV